MNFVTHRISLDIHDTSSQVLLRVKQGETSRKLHITLRESGQPYEIADGCTANLSAIKPDGNSIYNHCEIEGNTIIYTFTDQTTMAVGMMDYEVVLTRSNDQRIIAPRFSILVEEGLFSGDEVISSPEANVLDELIDRATVATEAAENVVDGLKKYAGDNFANAFDGYAEGTTIQVDDASPVEHNLRCTVKTKNLIPYPFVDTSITRSGLTFTDNGDGSIAVKGTVTADYSVFVLQNKLELVDGETYTLGDSSNIYLAYTDKNGTTKYVYNTTFTWSKDYTFVRLYLQFSKNAVVDTVLRPMLYVGDTAVDFVPYVDPTSVKVTRCGKNLLTAEGRTVTNFGAYSNQTNRVVKEGCIYLGLSVNNYYSPQYITSYDVSSPDKISFTVSNNSGYGLAFSYKARPGDIYTLSVGDRPTDSSRIAFSFYTHDGSLISYAITAMGSADKTVTATVPDNCAWMIVLLIGTVANTEITFSNVQLEFGSAATEYKASQVLETYSVNADGTVEGITSLFPFMNIFTDKANTTVSCKYNRDSGKVVQELYDFVVQETASVTKVSSVKLLASKWVGSASPYSQVVSIAGITENSMVDLTPSVEQLAVFYNKDLAFVTENEGGVVTVYAIGQKPQNDYTIQVAITEVKD